MSLYCTSTPYAFSYIQCRPIGGPGLYSVDQSDPYHALALPLGGAGHDGVVAGGVEAVVAQAARVRHVGVLVGILGARPVGRECSPQPGGNSTNQSRNIYIVDQSRAGTYIVDQSEAPVVGSTPYHESYSAVGPVVGLETLATLAAM